MKLTIISGGQTGVDQIGLGVAKSLGISTGGTAPKGYRTEDGPDYDLRNIYGLKESDCGDYNARTRQNIKDADVTLVFGNIYSAGSALTVRMCKQEGKLCLVNLQEAALVNYLRLNKPSVINIAGNRASKLTKEYMEDLEDQLTNAFKAYINNPNPS